MMANRHRGEIEAELGGRRFTLCLTLGALAELESAFGATDLSALATRFAEGRFAARDVLTVITAGLRGAGHDLTEEEVSRLATPGGAAGYVAILGALLAATFGTADDNASDVSPNPTSGGA